MNLKVALEPVGLGGPRTLTECHFCRELITQGEPRLVSAGAEDGPKDAFHQACFEFYVSCLSEFVDRVIRAAIAPTRLD